MDATEVITRAQARIAVLEGLVQPGDGGLVLDAEALALLPASVSETLHAAEESLRQALHAQRDDRMPRVYALRAAERLVYQVPGTATRLYYRRLTLTEHRDIAAANTARGVISEHSLGTDICQRALLGWEEYLDPVSQQPIPFCADDPVALRAEIVQLPPDVMLAVGRLAQSVIGTLSAQIKNSMAGSSVATP